MDIGCGTGQLAVECALRGHVVLGVDYAPGMIDAARAWSEQESATADFLCSSIFDVDLPPASFDVVSGHGLIEYMSLPEIDGLLNQVNTLLAPDGLLVLGSRNRLFNVVSLNEFSMLEVGLGTIESLIRESACIRAARSQEDLVEMLSSLETPQAKLDQHPNTGIDVATRWQFTPAELTQMLANRGFAAESAHAVNFHAVPVGCELLAGATHAGNVLRKAAYEEWDHDYRLIPYSSSFVIVARRIAGGDSL
jgi:SAM-dependent methyltransferase